MGEYPWAPAFASEDHEWISEWGWDEKLLHLVVLTAHSYHWERGYDCSMDDSIRGWIPSPYLVRTFDLRWTGRALSSQIRRAESSLNSRGACTLTMEYCSSDKAALEQYLDQHGLAIFWIVIGEKNVPYHTPGWGRSSRARIVCTKEM